MPTLHAIVLLGKWRAKSQRTSRRAAAWPSLASHSRKNKMYRDVTPPLPHWEEDHSYRKKPVNSTAFNNARGRRPCQDTNTAQNSEAESAVSVLHWRETKILLATFLSRTHSRHQAQQTSHRGTLVGLSAAIRAAQQPPKAMEHQSALTPQGLAKPLTRLTSPERAASA